MSTTTMSINTAETVRLSRRLRLPVPPPSAGSAAVLRQLSAAADPPVSVPRIPEQRRPVDVVDTVGDVVEDAVGDEQPIEDEDVQLRIPMLGSSRTHRPGAAVPQVVPNRSRHRASRSRARRENLVLCYVQPGLVGLIDGTLSTLAPIFAAALLSGTHAALFVGLATALGAGISMGLSEALSDDGSHTGRGSSIRRGAVTGVMTTVGGLFHALPFLLASTQAAIVLAVLVVAVELILIAYIRKRFMAVSMSSSLVQVVIGGAVIVGVGLLLGVV